MKPAFFSSLTTFLTALLASFSDLAPKQIILPFVKIKVAVFGRLSLKTRPWNLFGLYTVFWQVFIIVTRSISVPREEVAKTFCIST
jgi:hypothetical protein